MAPTITPPAGPVQHTTARGATASGSGVHSRGHCGTIAWQCPLRATPGDLLMALHTTQRRPQLHHLPATPETVHWGYFDGTLIPKLTIRSGDIVELETLTHRA